MPGKLDLTERLAKIVETQEAIASIRLDPDKVMGVVVKHVMDLTEADGAVLEMVREDEIHYHTAVGLLTPHVGTVFDIEGSVSGTCVRTRSALIVEDTKTDPRVNTEISSITGSRSMIVVPLVYEDDVVGVLKVTSTRPRGFDDLDCYSLQLMAGFVATSLTQAERYRAELASERRFRMLFDRNLSAAFITTPNGEVVEVNDSLVSLFGFASKEEALGDEVWERYENQDDRKALIDLLRTKKSLDRHRLRMVRKDGTRFDVLMNIDMVRGVEKTYLIGTMVEVGAEAN